MAENRKDEILDVAQALAQEKGLGGFSYIDLSKIIGIKTSSIHYYFPTKDELALALIERYHRNFKGVLEGISNTKSSPEEKLFAFAAIFKSLAEDRKRICLCGMLAAEVTALSDEAREELKRYFQTCTQWLYGLFLLYGSKRPEDDARGYLCLLEGALILARAEEQPDMVDVAAQSFLKK